MDKLEAEASRVYLYWAIEEEEQAMSRGSIACSSSRGSIACSSSLLDRTYVLLCMY